MAKSKKGGSQTKTKVPKPIPRPEYALVFYFQDKKTGVVLSSTIPAKTAPGETVMVREPVGWTGKRQRDKFQARFLQYGHDIEYLYSIKISTEGTPFVDQKNETNEEKKVLKAAQSAANRQERAQKIIVADKINEELSTTEDLFPPANTVQIGVTASSLAHEVDKENHLNLATTSNSGPTENPHNSVLSGNNINRKRPCFDLLSIGSSPSKRQKPEDASAISRAASNSTESSSVNQSAEVSSEAKADVSSQPIGFGSQGNSSQFQVSPQILMRQVPAAEGNLASPKQGISQEIQLVPQQLPQVLPSGSGAIPVFNFYQGVQGIIGQLPPLDDQLPFPIFPEIDDNARPVNFTPEGYAKFVREAEEAKAQRRRMTGETFPILDCMLPAPNKKPLPPGNHIFIDRDTLRNVPWVVARPAEARSRQRHPDENKNYVFPRQLVNSLLQKLVPTEVMMHMTGKTLPSVLYASIRAFLNTRLHDGGRINEPYLVECITDYGRGLLRKERAKQK
ncbi:Ran-binding protein 9 [Frankliniella fusca]|uniref:Ran-binding protein 9 n=1 Tax=Frankliniella fusca TaxID=407009 RepID=A0AAE1L503_9NEOP|nr:Ran-binding protein 9 [Frankliniella fusca]